MTNQSFPNVSKRFHERVVETLNSLPEQKENGAMYKKIKLKKGILIAAAAILILGGVVFAAGKTAMIYGYSNSKPDYTSLPSVTEIQKQIDAQPNIINEFSNEYTFKDGSIVHERYVDENEDEKIKYTSVDLRFYKDNKSINVSMKKSGIIPEEYDNIELKTYNNINMYYSEQTMKFVPPDYEKTEQDIADEASGKYTFSYGTSDVEVHDFKNISWDYNGVNYSLYCMDNDLTEQELYNMAIEIINAS
jgi:hypothetical protein